MLVIAFQSEKLKLLFQDLSPGGSDHSPEVIAALMKRTAELRAVSTLDDISPSCRQLIGDGTNQRIAINLAEGYKIHIAPNGQHVPYTPDGSPDWPRIRRIKILGIEKI